MTAATPTQTIPAFIARHIDEFEQRIRGWGGKDFFQGPPPPANSIYLVSNDYLNLSQHPAIVDAQVDALCNGQTMLMSALVVGALTDTPHHAFEQALAELMGAEEVVLCTSGWDANIGLIQTIAGPDVPVYIDMMAHASLWEGIRSAGATAHPFPHNNIRYLQKKIQRYGAGVIAVDSLYSTDGSLCPLHEVAELAQATGCALVVDEAHSLGTYGHRGEGMVAAAGLNDLVLFRTASLSKTFSSRGGIITCPSSFAPVFRTISRPAVFSSSVVSHEAVRFLKTLDVIQTEGWRRERLHANSAYLRDRLSEAGFDVSMSESMIIALEAKSEARVLAMRDLMFERGVIGALFAPPATAKNRCIIRLCVQAMHTREELDRVAEVSEEVFSMTEGL